MTHNIWIFLVLFSGSVQEASVGSPVEVSAELAPIQEAPVPVIHAVPVPVVRAPMYEAEAAGDWSRLRARQRLGKRLTGLGFAGLGAAFVGNIFAGVGSGVLGEDPSTVAGLVPVVGPFLMAGWTGADAPGYKAFFVLDGVAQAGFLAIGITGAVIVKRSRRALAQPRFFGLNGQLEDRLNNDVDLRRRGRLGLGLGLGGFGVFGITYFSTAMMRASAPDEGRFGDEPRVQRSWLLAPLVGPFVLAGQAEDPGTRALMAVLGVVQVGSLATGITGAVIRGRRTRDGELRVLLNNVAIAPWHRGTTTGLSLRGRF